MDLEVQADKTVMFAECECGSEILRIEHYDGDMEYYLSIFVMYDRPSFLNKLRQIWRILRTGTPYSDQIVLSQQEMRSIVYNLEMMVVETDENAD